MNVFKEVLEKRVKMLSKFSVISFVVAMIAGIYGYTNSKESSEHIPAFLQGVSFGLLLLFFGIIITITLKYYRAISNQESLENMYIKENDEREILIRDKVGRTSFYIVFSVMFLSSCILSFYNTIVSLTLYSVLFLMVVVKKLLHLHYEKTF